MHEKFGPLLDRTYAGVDQLLYYNNIAITALTVCLLFALFGNAYQYWSNSRRSDKQLDRDISTIKAMAGIEGAIDELKAIFQTIMQLRKD